MNTNATLGVAALLLGACGGASGLRVEKLGGGAYKLQCDSALALCLQRADTLCRGASFEVLRAQDHRDRLGGEVGSSNVENRSSIAHIRCTTTGRPLLAWEDLEAANGEESKPQPWKLPPRDPNAPIVGAPSGDEPPLLKPAPSAAPAQPGTATPAPSTALPASSKPAAAGSVCTPGATQACVGPAACNGGQSCLVDGSAYGPCDCGSQTPQPLKSSKPALP